MKGYITTSELAERLGVSSARIRKLIGDGKIKAEKVGPSHLIPEREAKRLESLERKPGRPAKREVK